MTANSASASAKQSERFNAADADIVFLSSDDVLFSIHKKNLETHTGSFPQSGSKADSEVIPLIEPSETLELLFQFMYPQRHPSLYETDFELLASLADAAEKYEVYSAMNICHIRMVKFLDSKQHAEHIMAYATKHGYKEVADLAAPLVVALPTGSVVQLLPQHLYLPWIIYRQQWQDNLITALMKLGSAPAHKCGNTNCPVLGNIMCALTIKALSAPMHKLVTEVFERDRCGNCRNADKFHQWENEIDEMMKRVDPFSKFS